MSSKFKKTDNKVNFIDIEHNILKKWTKEGLTINWLEKTYRQDTLVLEEGVKEIVEFYIMTLN